MKTRKQKTLTIIRDLAAIVAFLSFGLGLFVNYQQGQTAQCVNDVLATRSAPGNADTQAHVAFAKALSDAFKVNAKDPAERAAASKRLQREITDYYNILSVDQAYRDAHPLGAC